MVYMLWSGHKSNQNVVDYSHAIFMSFNSFWHMNVYVGSYYLILTSLFPVYWPFTSYLWCVLYTYNSWNCVPHFPQFINTAFIVSCHVFLLSYFSEPTMIFSLCYIKPLKLWLDWCSPKTSNSFINTEKKISKSCNRMICFGIHL